MTRLHLCLLWHFHQPIYRDPLTGEYLLPWVRLHATRSYYDMPRVLAEHEGARAVLNWAPSLLHQLEDYVHGRARDRFLELTLRPADALTGSERAFVLRFFFMVNWERNVRPLPRYAELLEKRGRDVTSVDLASLASRFSVGELRDLQVLFNLAWMGFRAEQDEEVVRELKEKGRDFTEADKQSLVAVQQRVLESIVPGLKRAADDGLAELAVTPFYHPILPLLIDSDVARRSMPHAELPPRFVFPEDAREQVRRALALAEARFGRRPDGMWPAEGSVSPETVALLAEHGVRWCASDEGVLLHSQPRHSRERGAIHRAYRVRAGAGEIAMVFRDRGLSDHIGFSYAGLPARQAVDDLYRHLDGIARAFAHFKSGEVPLVTLALDGENAWEHYPHSGRDFLRELYGRLSRREGGIEPVLLGEYLKAHPPREHIEELHSGSWIDANFRIWIGHPEDNLAWSLLRQAREAVEERERGLKPRHAGADLARAREALYVAEGSDWFWWYGDDFTTESAAEFDALFRGYLRAAWQAMAEPVPARLESPISRLAAPTGPRLLEPRGFVGPDIDGRAESYLEWAGAVEYAAREGLGSMHQAEPLMRTLHLGFDAANLYLRFDPSSAPDPAREMATSVLLELGAAGARCEVDIPLREQAPVTLRSGGRLAPGAPVGQAAFRDVLEVGVAFDSLGLSPGTRVTLVARIQREGQDVERLPRHGELVFVVPDQDFERRNWRV